MQKGIIYMLLSAVVFALSTVFAKFASSDYCIDGIEISFFRFLFGLIFFAAYMAARKKRFRANMMKYVILRSVTNAAAVMLFFAGIQHTSITNANMLNMTYPAFVFLAAPFINRERITGGQVIFLILTLAGGYLIINPSGGTVGLGDILSFLSGAVGGVAVSSLREARKYDDTDVILFYLMVMGTLMNGAAVLPVFKVPGVEGAGMIAAATVLSLTGQYLITAGYKYIEAGPGAIISSSRILFGALLGLWFFGDLINASIIIGGILIIISFIGISGIFDKKDTGLSCQE